MSSSTVAAAQGFCNQAELQPVFLTGTYWSLSISPIGQFLKYVRKSVVLCIYKLNLDGIFRDVTLELQWNILHFFVSSHLGRCHLRCCHLALTWWSSLVTNPQVLAAHGSARVSLPPFDPPLLWLSVMVLFLSCLPHQLVPNTLGACLSELLRDVFIQ